mgnify:CR=1 FL=1
MFQITDPAEFRLGPWHRVFAEGTFNMAAAGGGRRERFSVRHRRRVLGEGADFEQLAAAIMNRELVPRGKNLASMAVEAAIVSIGRGRAETAHPMAFYVALMKFAESIKNNATERIENEIKATCDAVKSFSIAAGVRNWMLASGVAIREDLDEHECPDDLRVWAREGEEAWPVGGRDLEAVARRIDRFFIRLAQLGANRRAAALAEDVGVSEEDQQTAFWTKDSDFLRSLPEAFARGVRPAKEELRTERWDEIAEWIFEDGDDDRHDEIDPSLFILYRCKTGLPIEPVSFAGSMSDMAAAKQIKRFVVLRGSSNEFDVASEDGSVLKDDFFERRTEKLADQIANGWRKALLGAHEMCVRADEEIEFAKTANPFSSCGPLGSKRNVAQVYHFARKTIIYLFKIHLVPRHSAQADLVRLQNWGDLPFSIHCPSSVTVRSESERVSDDLLSDDQRDMLKEIEDEILIDLRGKRSRPMVSGTCATDDEGEGESTDEEQGSFAFEAKEYGHEEEEEASCRRRRRRVCVRRARRVVEDEDEEEYE